MSADAAERRFPDWDPWAAVIGERIRRLRRERKLGLIDLLAQLELPAGRTYVKSWLSQLERGRASGPLYFYLAIAAALELHPSVLLGPDGIDKPLSEGEETLPLTLRELGLSPSEALARLVAI